MSTVLITGGTGLVGTALTKALIERGDDIIILTRKIPGEKNKKTDVTSQIRYALWNVKQQTIDKKAIQQADYIVHLAGANVAEKKWTEKRKHEIVDSRVKSAELIIKALKEFQIK